MQGANIARDEKTPPSADFSRPRGGDFSVMIRVFALPPRRRIVSARSSFRFSRPRAAVACRASRRRRDFSRKHDARFCRRGALGSRCGRTRRPSHRRRRVGRVARSDSRTNDRRRGSGRRNAARRNPKTQRRRAPPRLPPAPPPSLREVFAALAPTPLLLVVELKDFRPRAAAAAAALVDLLDDFPGLGARVIVGGFDGAIAAAFARARQSAKDPATRATATAASVTEARILISLGVLRLDFLWPTKSRALLIPPRGGGCGLITRNIVARAHRRGQAIWHWTINDAPTMRKIAQVGGDGIITDRPIWGARFCANWAANCRRRSICRRRIKDGRRVFRIRSKNPASPASRRARHR